MVTESRNFYADEIYAALQKRRVCMNVSLKFQRYDHLGRGITCIFF